MMSAKLANAGLLKIMKFQIKPYDVIILDYDVKDKVLALDSNHIVNVAM